MSMSFGHDKLKEISLIVDGELGFMCQVAFK